MRGKRPIKKRPLSVRVHAEAREALIKLSLAESRSQGNLVERYILQAWRAFQAKRAA